MQKAIIIIIIFLVVIFLMGRIGDYWTRSQLSKIRQTLPVKELPQNQSQLSLEEILKSLPTTQEGPQQFISPDGKFKMDYPGGWMKIEDQMVLEALAGTISSEWEAKYNLETLFFAQKPKIGKYAQLVVRKGEIAVSKKLENLIEMMEKNNQEQGIKMEIIESDPEAGTLEAKYQKTGRPDLHSKEKILFLKTAPEKKTFYLIIFITLDKDWWEFKEEADSIINSAQLLL